MVAVHRPLSGIERALDRVAGGELVADLADGGPPGLHHGQRDARPDQYADRDACRSLGEQLLQDDRPLVPGHGKGRRAVPAGDVDVRSGSRDAHCHRMERVGSIDQHLDRVARSWRRIILSPSARRGIDGSGPANVLEPSPVV